MYYGLTSLGVVHTIISLLAVAAGAFALIRDGKIIAATALGKFYIATTILVCLTGFGIFQHGGFGKPHVLGIITLLTFGVAYLANRKKAFSKKAYVVEIVCYTTTFFFHLVPAVTETATRLPLSAPLASSQEDPGIKMVIGICFVLFLIGTFFQVRKLKQTN